MELDVQLSKDGRVVVFHDDTLNRVCGVDARVDALTFEQLRQLRLCGSDQTIPLFSEVLDMVAGRGPLIVELKSGPRNRELCEKTLLLLEGYEGEYCIESFDPNIVGWFRVHAPHILRGQLATPPRLLWSNGIRALRSLIFGNLLADVISRPQFIAYRIGPKPFAVRFAEALGAMPFGWTSHSRDSESGRDAVIFEYYRPDIRFK
jgi:glycerophosphoryl diester phosphodiesterase